MNASDTLLQDVRYTFRSLRRDAGFAAFACVLLVGAGLLIRSFVRVLDVNLGFRPERAASVRVDPDRHMATQAQANAYFDEVLRRAKTIPGIEATGLTDALPLGRNRS